LDALRAGATRSLAAQYAGWHPSQTHRYLEKAKRVRKGRFHEFRTAYDEAIAACQMRFVATISTAATKDWRAAAWFLERLNPEYAAANNMTLKGADGGTPTIQIIHSIPSVPRPAPGSARVVAVDGGTVPPALPSSPGSA